MDPILMLFGQHPREDWRWTLVSRTSGWDRGNALALANCALLAYCDQAEIGRQLRQREFTEVIPCDSDPGPIDTQAYVAARSDAVVVAFRGTEPTNLQDFATDFDAAQVPFETKLDFPSWGRIHEGWADGVNVVRKKIVAALSAFEDGARALWITGHSLGGALAMVAAAMLANEPKYRIAGVYTFGQPRVGDPTFRSRYDELLGRITFRCVNDRDLVPHVPPRELSQIEQGLFDPSAGRIAKATEALVHGHPEAARYEHAGQLRLLLANGGLSENVADETAREPEFLAHPRTAQSLLLDFGRLLVQSPDRLKDHAPVNPISHDGYVERIEALL
jgi:triacylglycerol lipase